MLVSHYAKLIELHLDELRHRMRILLGGLSRSRGDVLVPV
jgi:hypothetical protein